MATVGYQTIFLAAAPVFLIMGAGFGLRRMRWLTREADASLLKLVVRVLYPCLIFSVATGNPALDNAANLAFSPLTGCCTVLLGFLLAYYAASFLEMDPNSRRTFAFSTGLYNYGFIPIPLIALLFPGSETMGVLFVHNLGVEIAYWTAGIMIVSGTALREAYKKILNPPAAAILAALAVNAAGWGNAIPVFLDRSLSMLAACAIPLGLILCGAILADFFKEVTWRKTWKISLAACAVRLGLLPPVFALLACWLPVTIELKRVIVVQAAMPAAVFPIVIARHYGGRPGVAVQVVLTTSALALVLIPFWIAFGLRLISG